MKFEHSHNITVSLKIAIFENFEKDPIPNTAISPASVYGY